MTLTVSDISFSYSNGIDVLLHESLQVPEGEVIALVGPSGCGKSTLLHCIAGLLQPSSGFIEVGGVDVTNTKPHERGIGIMMQDQPLYEHLSIEQNIAFPLRARGEKKPNVTRILEQLELTSIAKQKVSKCSGGERRRVAFGRAIVIKPKVLLLDEPFVSLNEELRETMRGFIQSVGVTTLLVTHDVTEVESIANRTVELY